MSTRSAQLGLEELDSRTLPNATMPIVAAPMMGETAHAVVAHPLQGTGGAKYVESTGGTGNQYSLSSGSVTLSGLGSFKLTGSIQSAGSASQSEATGELVLSNSQGTIAISLQGSMQPPGSGASTFTYTITGGTGAYQNLSGSGNLQATFGPAPIVYGGQPQGQVHVVFS